MLTRRVSSFWVKALLRRFSFPFVLAFSTSERGFDGMTFNLTAQFRKVLNALRYSLSVFGAFDELALFHEVNPLGLILLKVFQPWCSLTILINLVISLIYFSPRPLFLRSSENNSRLSSISSGLSECLGETARPALRFCSSSTILASFLSRLVYPLHLMQLKFALSRRSA